MKPSQLARQLTQIIADTCGVDVVWPQRPLTRDEVARIATLVERKIEDTCNEVSKGEEKANLRF